MINEEKQNNDTVTRYDSAKKIEEFLNEIEAKINTESDVTMHTMLAINDLLRNSKTPQSLTDATKERIKTIWNKISLTGLELNQPPLIFGTPELFVGQDIVTDDNLDDGTEVVSITLPPDKEECSKKKTATKNEDDDEYDDDDDEDCDYDETDSNADGSDKDKK